MVTYRQSCKWSRFTWFTTVFVIGFLGLLGCMNSPRPCDEWLHFLVRALLLVLVLCAAYYCPLFIEVNHTHFHIIRLLRKKAIPLADIAVAIPFGIKNKRMLRLCGAGGFAGFWGMVFRFRHRPLLPLCGAARHPAFNSADIRPQVCGFVRRPGQDGPFHPTLPIPFAANQATARSGGSMTDGLVERHAERNTTI